MTTAIIIGGGIAGCSTAYALAQKGIAVTVIERHEKIAQEASGNPIAVLYPKFSVKPNMADKLTQQGSTFTQEILKKLSSQVPIFEACGMIQLAFNPREEIRQNALMQLDQYQSIFKAINSAEATKIAGVSLNMGGLYLPQAGWIKPAVFCEALTNSALIKKMTLTKALKFDRKQHRWQVCMDKNQSIEADILVICNANDVKQFKQCESVAITPVRGQINFFPENTISKSIKTIICSDHFVSPAVDGFHSTGTTYAANDFNPNLTEVDTRKNIDALCKISEPLCEAMQHESINGRVAWRSSPLDYMPLAGQLLDGELIHKNPPRHNANAADLPWIEGLYINAGHGSKGMITAPICGELIANLVANGKPDLEAPFASKLNPSRFLLRELGLKQLAQSLY